MNNNMPGAPLNPTSTLRVAVRWLVALILMLIAQKTYAHPGHSLPDHGLLHVVSSPFHLLVLAGAATALWAAAHFVQGPRRRLLQGTASAVTLVTVFLCLRPLL
jgi:hypothetical protein